MKRERRSKLLRLMDKRAESVIDCRACTAVCCTAAHNTMQIDVLEAVDIFLALRGAADTGLERWDEALRSRLLACIKRYRLDIDLPLPMGKQLRRSYTCVFHRPERRNNGYSFACTLALESKPMGCLAFNPDRGGQLEGGACRSDQAALLSREQECAHFEVLQRERLERLLGLGCNAQSQAPIPVMLLRVADAVEALGVDVRDLKLSAAGKDFRE